MHWATHFHYNPEIWSPGCDTDRLLCEGGTTDSFGMVLSRSMHIGKLQEKIQDALQKEWNASENDVLPQE